MRKQLSQLHMSGEKPEPSCILEQCNVLDVAFDKYVVAIEADEALFDLGPYNDKNRNGGVNYRGLAALPLIIEAMLTWCTDCAPDKGFLKETAWVSTFI